MTSDAVKKKISKTLAKYGGRGKHTRAWIKRPALVARVTRVFEMYERGMPIMEIAKKEGVAWSTVQLDVQRAREVALVQLAKTIEGKRTEHISRRLRLQGVAYSDHDEADVGDRAPFLREIRENQTGIEELDGLREKDAPPPSPTVVVVQVGDSPPKQVEELSDEQLIELTGETVEAEYTEGSGD